MIDNIAQSIGQNPSIAVLAVFLGGIISSASPCVLAVIPIVIGYVGGHTQGDRRAAAIYAAVFALGLAITFTILGVCHRQVVG